MRHARILLIGESDEKKKQRKKGETDSGDFTCSKVMRIGSS